MDKNLSVCGCNCLTCEHYKKLNCAGCAEIKGRVWWASYISVEVCPVYNCVVNERKLEHCGKCHEIPCKIWRDLKDPSYTNEQHEASIIERVKILKG